MASCGNMHLGDQHGLQWEHRPQTCSQPTQQHGQWTSTWPQVMAKQTVEVITASVSNTDGRHQHGLWQ